VSGSAFLRSLEDKILGLKKQTGIPISRYRKTIAFNRFLAVSSLSTDLFLKKYILKQIRILRKTNTKMGKNDPICFGTNGTNPLERIPNSNFL
jgi:hypothetical protein